ncbi:hypothetical protein RFI_30022, partial [Reticulomyxa filosa]
QTSQQERKEIFKELACAFIGTESWNNLLQVSFASFLFSTSNKIRHMLPLSQYRPLYFFVCVVFGSCKQLCNLTFSCIGDDADAHICYLEALIQCNCYDKINDATKNLFLVYSLFFFKYKKYLYSLIISLKLTGTESCSRQVL